MRRIATVSIVVLFLLAVSFSASAEEEKGSMMGEGMMQGGMMGKKGMMKSGQMMGMCPMHKMMSKEMVATEDGGVIVMVGNKLLKYDKNLNLKKEVEIKMDMEGMQKMMKEMMEKCPMRKMMMEKGMMQEGKMMGETAEESETPKEKSEHETHH